MGFEIAAIIIGVAVYFVREYFHLSAIMCAGVGAILLLLIFQKN